MDFMRSCYTVPMIFRTDDPPLNAAWYFVDCDHEAFPAWHAFGSRNWESRIAETGAIGEQPGARPWRNGSRPINAGDGDAQAVECAEVEPTYWTNGIPSSVETGPYDANGLPTCCTETPLCCGCDMPDIINVDSFGFGCSCIDGQTFSCVRQGTACEWLGPVFDCNGKDWQLRLFVEGEPPSACSIQAVIMCDGVDVGQEGAELDCVDEEVFITINPLLNDCCNATTDLDLYWEF